MDKMMTINALLH